MKSPRTRLAAAALVLATPLISACGFNIQTDQTYQPAIGANNRAGTVDVLNALVVSAEEGSGRFISTFVNKSTKDGIKVLSINAGDAEATALGNELAPESLLNLADAAPVTIQGEKVAPGGYVAVTIDFSNGQSTTINAPVVAARDEFKELGPGGATSPEPSDDASADASTESH